MRLRRASLISLFTGAVVSAPVFAQTPAATLARAVATYRAASTMRVSFDQTLTNPLTANTMTSHGELVRKKPNLLSISFADPAKDRIVADGTSLWVYLPSSAPGQVIKLPASKSPGAMIDPLGQVLTSPRDRFTLGDAGTATISGRATHAVSLVPKRGTDALFTKATVWVDDKDGTVRQIETTEQSGVNRQIVITKLSTNVPVPRGTFVFTPPAKVRVIDGQSAL